MDRLTLRAMLNGSATLAISHLLNTGIVLSVVAFGTLVFWCVAASRLRRVMASRPTVRRGLDTPFEDGAWPAVSIVIPAHNEERVIADCAASLKQLDYPNFNVIFVLDRCTDDTLTLLQNAVAGDARFQIIENETCPDDWAGKCNAARVGADAATGEILIFTDADTEFDPMLLRASIGLAHEDKRDLLSLLSTLSRDAAFERIVQPVTSIQLMQIYPIERVNRRDKPRPFANGQFLQFSRAAYDRIGGHEAVHNDLLEDIAFARRMHDMGGSGGIYLADGMLRCAMYSSFEQFRFGWQRIYVEACRRSPQRLRKYAFHMFAAGPLALAVQIGAIVVGLLLIQRGASNADVIVGSASIALAVAARVTEFVVLAATYRFGGSRRRDAIFFPIGAAAVAKIFWTAASDLVRRVPIRWGGRSYVLEPSREG